MNPCGGSINVWTNATEYDKLYTPMAAYGPPEHRRNEPVKRYTGQEDFNVPHCFPWGGPMEVAIISGFWYK